MPYSKKNVHLSKVLRKNMTPWERKLWYEFLKDYPIKFYRQRPIGDYIVDFYCARKNLVIELDGSGHYTAEQKLKDAERTEFLERAGLRVMRISNNDVYSNFEGICEAIDRVVNGLNTIESFIES